jgi:molybdate transport system substrate-binding protein
MMRQLILAVLLALVAAGTAGAEEIRVLSAGSLQRGLARIAEAYTARTGHDVTIEVGTTPVMRQRLEAGDSFDVVVAAPAVVESAVERGQLDGPTAVGAARVGIGIGVREGVRIPDVRTVDDLKALLLSADTVVYNRGSSGVYSQSLIESLGITDEIADGTTQYANGGQVVSHVLEGDGMDLGFAPLTELRANESNGLRLIALPDAVQNYTSYQAVVTIGAVEAAADFVRYLTTPEAREAFAATGVD